MVALLVLFMVLMAVFVLSACKVASDADRREEELYKARFTEPTSAPANTPSTWMKYNVPLDDDLQKYIYDTCSRYGVSPSIVMAQIGIESNYDPGAIGDNGNSFGLMQIYKSCHEDRMKRLGVTDLLDPKQNVLVGIDLMAELIGRGNGIEWALSYYTGWGGQDCAYSHEVLSDAEQLLEGVMINGGGI